MSSMARLAPIIHQRVLNGDSVMPSDIWASAYTHLETDITAERIQAEIDAAQIIAASRSTAVPPYSGEFEGK